MRTGGLCFRSVVGAGAHAGLWCLPQQTLAIRAGFLRGPRTSVKHPGNVGNGSGRLAATQGGDLTLKLVSASVPGSDFFLGLLRGESCAFPGSPELGLPSGGLISQGSAVIKSETLLAPPPSPPGPPRCQAAQLPRQLPMACGHLVP